MHEVMSYRRFGRARSLRSDRALGRYVTTKLWFELGRYVATGYVATERAPGRYVATERNRHLRRSSDKTEKRSSGVTERHLRLSVVQKPVVCWRFVAEAL
ncbi:hypothetical protein F2Q68_00035936 [Brassica cretica]|uniref:Uncharacterized protein n=1 Tax=Brassica cretica TaxID=69181 RepID=A0A8S9H445_BRACR|nr:hypothetical protein F2Q68_00035936 [Brassica cretica]